MKRREFLAGAAALQSTAPRPPNVLFCITDDQSWLHASAYGAKWIQTPAFDQLAQEGALFRNAFVATPSCGPARAAILTGQDFYRLGSASMNHTEWPAGLESYPDILAARGYKVGYTGKGWGPGNWRVHGRTVSPTGPEYNAGKLRAPTTGISPIDYAGNLASFLRERNTGQPFCFWAGFQEPHRIFEAGKQERQGAAVPPFLPDTPEVRRDLTDYAIEIEWLDRQLGLMVQELERTGELDNTLIVFTSDNGMAFPRAKGNLYDYGTRIPMAIRWGARIKGGQAIDDLVSTIDLAPTISDAVGGKPPIGMTGRSLLPRLTGKSRTKRSDVVFGIERHFPGSRPDGAGYPSRAIRTERYLYIENLTPERSPMGDRPGPVWPDDDPTGGFGDSDGGPAKTVLCEPGRFPELHAAAFGKRPAVELYDVQADPANMKNLAGAAGLRRVQSDLKRRLDAHRRRTSDPRIHGKGDDLDAVMRRFPSIAPGVARQQEGRTPQ